MSTAHEFLTALAEIPDLDITTEVEFLEQLRLDKSGQLSDGRPLVFAEPHTVVALQHVMRCASNHRVPVVPRGGGSGLAGGAMGGPGDLVLSLMGLNRILEISVADRLAVVEAGVINADLNAEAMRQGLWFAPDPSSRPWSTVGGNIATNAGGLLCAKYGVTRESVLGLDVVLPSGELIHTGRRSVKGVTGLDLTSLMIGSEGVLGVVVSATVKLLPLDPHSRWTISATCGSIDIATAACEDITRRGITPAVLELIDPPALRYIRRYLGQPEASSPESLVVAQADGADSTKVAEEIASIFRFHGAIVESYTPGDQAEALLHQRRSMHPAMEAVGTVLIEDVCVPRSALGAMFREIRDIEKAFGVEIPTVAHAGDGNLHPNFIYEGEQVPEHIWQAADALFTRAIALGGTLTGEHGVGLLKRRWLRDELGERQWQLQRAIKAVFDPQGIMNPGKVFAPLD
jgi:glycolate oxidase